MPLPFQEVNAYDSLEIAGILDLDDSPSEKRKFVCPLCGGWNLHAWATGKSGPHFLCHSGCGNKHFSNVDMAAVIWGMEPADACRALADRLGIAVLDPPKPPFAEVGRADGPDVARVLGLAGPEGGPYRCPQCGGADTLEPRGPRWWKCSTPSCPEMGFNHVDLAMRVWNLRPSRACLDLADRLGIGPAAPAVARPRPAPPKREAKPAVDPLDSIPGAVRPPAVYGEILSRLSLRGHGAVHIVERRRLDPREAAEYGFRSVSPKEWHDIVLPYLETLRDEELSAAGFPREDKNGTTRIWLPAGGRSHMLVMPYRAGVETVSLRFRDLSDDPDAIRYWSLKGANPPLPFNADALGASTVHIMEGEMNAFTLASFIYQIPATGKPGAGIWNDEWTARVKGADLVVGWYDNDLAGRRGARNDRKSMIRMHGEGWTERHWRRILLSCDASDLHRERELSALLHERPWDGPDALHTAAIVEAEEIRDGAEEEALRTARQEARMLEETVS